MSRTVLYFSPREGAGRWGKRRVGPTVCLAPGGLPRLLPSPSLYWSLFVLTFVSPITRDLLSHRSPTLYFCIPSIQLQYLAHHTCWVNCWNRFSFKALNDSFGRREVAIFLTGVGRSKLTEKVEQGKGRNPGPSNTACFIVLSTHLWLIKAKMGRELGFWIALHLHGIEGILQTTCA